MSEPAASEKVPAYTRWLIIGVAALLIVLTLAAATGLSLHAWYIRQNNNRWCQFYATITAQHLEDRALQVELEHLKVETGCK